MTERNKKLSLAGRLRMVAACPDANASLCAEAADAIEEHEAFRQKVSDAVREYKEDQPHIWKQSASGYFSHFIIPAPKPDPLVEAMKEVGLIPVADNLRAALEARGLEIRKKNDD